MTGVNQLNIEYELFKLQEIKNKLLKLHKSLRYSMVLIFIVNPKGIFFLEVNPWTMALDGRKIKSKYLEKYR